MATVPLNRPAITLHQFPQRFAQVDKAWYEHFAADALRQTNSFIFMPTGSITCRKSIMHQTNQS